MLASKESFAISSYSEQETNISTGSNNEDDLQIDKIVRPSKQHIGTVFYHHEGHYVISIRALTLSCTLLMTACLVGTAVFACIHDADKLIVKECTWTKIPMISDVLKMNGYDKIYILCSVFSMLYCVPLTLRIFYYKFHGLITKK